MKFEPDPVGRSYDDFPFRPGKRVVPTREEVAISEAPKRESWER